jgi:hypothetical protein
MRRLPVLILIAAFVCAAAYGAARPQPAAALGYVDLRVKQNVLLLRGYVDTQAARHGFLYPTRAEVRKGGGLSAPVWPVNPWTGKPMAPGSSRGTYTYTPAADRRSYTLVAHFSKGGTYQVTGRSPGWLATERATAASDLAAAQSQLAAAQADLATAQADLATARDTEAELGARVIKGYIEQWGLLNNGKAPMPGQITSTGVGAGFGFWPKNPWDSTDMATGSGNGDFDYWPSADGAYALTTYTGTGPVDLSGSVPQQLANAMTTLRDELMKADMYYLQATVDRYALDNNDVFPHYVSKQALNDYAFDYWPKNPWTWTDMVSGTNPGDFTFSVTGGYDSYQIAGHLSDGTDYVVDDYWTTRFLGMRQRLKDLCVQGYAQVLKDYADQWKVENGGVPAAPAEMTAGGQVGSAHTWWPTNPWTNSPMTQGGGTGQYDYVVNGDGSFTITVREAPFTDPLYGGAFPEYYTAQ